MAWAKGLSTVLAVELGCAGDSVQLSTGALRHRGHITKLVRDPDVAVACDEQPGNVGQSRIQIRCTQRAGWSVCRVETLSCSERPSSRSVPLM
jgi:hypothetical protein